jgi:hypothetical protein
MCVRLRVCVVGVQRGGDNDDDGGGLVFELLAARTLTHDATSSCFCACKLQAARGASQRQHVCRPHGTHLEVARGSHANGHQQLRGRVNLCGVCTQR